MKTIKQIKNLKAYKNSIYKTWVWTARLINGVWYYGWWEMENVEQNNEYYIDGIKNKYEYIILKGSNAPLKGGENK